MNLPGDFSKPTGYISVDFEKIPTFLDLKDKELIVVVDPDRKIYEFDGSYIQEQSLLDFMLERTKKEECIFLDPTTLP